MALINCPECGKEVSDKSKQCTHCGCPLTNYRCVIYGVEYDFTREYNMLFAPGGDWLKVTGQVRLKTSLTWTDGKALVMSMLETKNVPKIFEPQYPLEDRSIYEKQKSSLKSSITCPYCNSANTKKISVASKAAHTAVFGIFSMGRNSKNYHCNACGSDF